jgi:hypothetical protein
MAGPVSNYAPEIEDAITEYFDQMRHHMTPPQSSNPEFQRYLSTKGDGDFMSSDPEIDQLARLSDAQRAMVAGANNEADIAGRDIKDRLRVDPLRRADYRGF